MYNFLPKRKKNRGRTFEFTISLIHIVHYGLRIYNTQPYVNY